VSALVAFGFAFALVAAPPCTPTLPNGTQPPPEVVYSPAFSDGRLAEAYRAGRTKPDKHFHGNGEIWTTLSSDGRYVMSRSRLAADGTIGFKMLWYLAHPGPMTLSARRLDATAAAAVTSVGDALGEPRFHSSGVVFPSAGCWEVSARTRGSTLTFVMDVAIEGLP
jgi:hypothetical protein